MYAIVVYDVEANRTRIFLNLLRRYLTHVQNSVFEGELSEGALNRLREEIDAKIEPGESVIIYEMSSDNWVDRTVHGEDPAADDQFL